MKFKTAIVSLFWISGLTGCGNLISKNEDAIQKIVLERQLSAGHHLESFRIVNHLDSQKSLTIFVEGRIDSVQSFSDTIRFPLTMDGLIVR